MRNAIQISDSRKYIREAWEKTPGASSSQIALIASEAAGWHITRNAVMGQLRRLGLKLSNAKGADQEPVEQKPKAKAHAKRVMGFKGLRMPRLVTEPMKPRLVSKSLPIDPAWGDVVAGEGVKEPCGCCWVYGNPGPQDNVWRYCQDAKLSNKPYCADHAAIAYFPLDKKRERSFKRHAEFVGRRFG